MAKSVGDVVNAFSASITSETEVIAAPGSGRRHVIRAMHLHSGTAGLVVFRDGLAGSTLFKQYLEANKPLTVGPEVFGANGLKLTAGNALTAELSSATLTALIRTTVE